MARASCVSEPESPPPTGVLTICLQKRLSARQVVASRSSAPSGGQQQVSQACDHGAQWARQSARWEITSSSDPNQSRRDLRISHTAGGTPPPTRSGEYS